jgi:hypothetical protein
MEAGDSLLVAASVLEEKLVTARPFVEGLPK